MWVMMIRTTPVAIVDIVSDPISVLFSGKL